MAIWILKFGGRVLSGKRLCQMHIVKIKCVLLLSETIATFIQVGDSIVPEESESKEYPLSKEILLIFSHFVFW